MVEQGDLDKNKKKKIANEDKVEKASQIENSDSMNNETTTEKPLLQSPYSSTEKEGPESAIKRENSSPTLPPFGLAKNILSKIKKDEDTETKHNEIPTNQLASKRDETQPSTLKEKSIVKFVTFYLENEEYGLPISQVQEIIRVGDITRLPNAPEYVRGVINLRGKILSVIELKKRLQLGETELNKYSRIVVIELQNKHVGLLVDRVSKVLNLDNETIERAPEEGVSVNENFAKGVAMDKDRMIIILDLDKILKKSS